MIASIDKRLKAVEDRSVEQYRDLGKEILRLQILNGIDSNRFSRSELLYFFDKYKSYGGNSFVEDKVHEHLQSLEKEDDVNGHSS